MSQPDELRINRPILLVEDNPMDVDLTRRALVKQKVFNPLQVARDGEEALVFFERWETGEPLPVVILLDIRLPKMSGLEVLHRLKTNPLYRKIPVVMLTSSDEERDIRTAYHQGANSYIVKPVDFEGFVEVAARIGAYWNGINVPPR
jgi:CheY-like chemotaxis protein